VTTDLEAPASPWDTDVERHRPTGCSCGRCLKAFNEGYALALSNVLGVMNPYVPEAIEDLIAEIHRQDVKWGQQDHPDGTGQQFSVEQANLAKLQCQNAFAEGNGTWRLVLAEEFFEALAETDADALMAELQQVAGVAEQWIASIRRRIAGTDTPGDGQPIE